MKIRIRFSKTGPIRFTGHLDFMRSFQKTLKKSGLPAVYSSGFNPHMMISFAAPLGVGEETLGDYADVDFAYRDRHEMTGQEEYRLTDIGLDNDSLPDPPSAEEFIRAVNKAAPPGVEALSAVRVGLIKSSKAMALVRYAGFSLPLKDSFLSGYAAEDLKDAVSRFMEREEILLTKKTKKSEKEVNIRPLIVSMGVSEKPVNIPDLPSDFGKLRSLNLICAQGSSQNLKPSAVMEALAAFLSEEYDPFDFRVVRLDLMDEGMTPLGDLGDAF